LQLASWQGHIDVVRILLEKGADPNVPDEKRGSAIQAASQCGHQRIVKLLRESGAVEVVAKSAATALE
jgi:ankyrin repeat protein